ncbi:MAG: hypothetical protein PVH29_14610 [Candidatus Zixiibacteriota bacterium]|jgi:hypothetical protein
MAVAGVNGAEEMEPAKVPTLAEAIAQAPNVVRVEILEVPEEGPVYVEVREVYWGEFENEGWINPTYDVPDEEGDGTHEVKFEFRPGEQYVLFGDRSFGGLYHPYLYWNTRWGVADVVEGEMELARFAEGPRRMPLAEFRELVKEIKWGL